MNYTISPMTEKHLSGIKAIDDLCFDVPWSFASFQNELSNPLAVYFVALSDNGQVIGYGGYWWIFDEGHITNIAVHPSFRRHGIGQELIQAMVDKCATTNVYTLTLEVRKSNTGAQQLYRKMGFREVGLRPKYYQNKEDAVLMTKEVAQVD